MMERIWKLEITGVKVIGDEENELKRLVKEVMIKDWIETFLSDARSVRETMIKEIDVVLEHLGDIKLSEFREVIHTRFDYVLQEIREQLLAGFEEKGLLK